jgi:light-regulated signal transduction histidine kinase (bacteriophytochrome)
VGLVGIHSVAQSGSAQWRSHARQPDDALRRAELLAATNRRLEKSNRELHHFASVVAHDLKSPLSTISAMSAWLCDEYQNQLDPDAQEYLKFMNQAVCRMNALVDAVLQYSKADGAPQAVPEPVNLDEILKWTLANLHSEIRCSQAVITSDVLPEVKGSESELAQVLQNLISNAIRFRNPSRPPAINVTAIESEREWTFSIVDNGIGIEPEQHERIFTPFERLNPETPGVGLGLPICRKVIEKHGGRIWVEAQTNEGSVFRFTLPK